ncbi:MAG: BtpA/SgcQ family protein [Phycisphaerales bacterium]|nr:BtpA/SgcQ family protein [Phycisphaerales bacterium]
MQVERDTLIGMVHVGALAGTPLGGECISAITDRAVAEAALLDEAGFDAILLENMHDAPYLLRDVGPEIVAGMTAATAAVRSAVQVPVGVQILAGANRAALAVAQACGGSFIRAEGFAYATVADEGLLHEADAGPLLRERKRLGAQVSIWADVQKKHSAHALTGDLDIVELAHGTAFMGADAVILSGPATGRRADLDQVRRVSDALDIPVIVGSGVDATTVKPTLAAAHAVIVGSAIKIDGHWANTHDPEAVKRFVDAAR